MMHTDQDNILKNPKMIDNKVPKLQCFEKVNVLTLQQKPSICIIEFLCDRSAWNMK